MSTPEEREDRAARTHREALALLAAERKARDEKTARLRALREAAAEPAAKMKTRRRRTVRSKSLPGSLTDTPN
jgi:hypothetical protein